ncbi:MAG: transcriptional repressor [Arachidicoccus sp.]|nr:transcriptional repressor [Arachidicoccus sp.]
MNAVIDILKENNLSITDGRKQILSLFLKTDGALSHADIEKEAHKKLDRITIYRTLQTFVNKGIIHVIPTTDNSILYALCRDECSEGHHHDKHVHFVCNECHTTYCLEQIDVPQVSLPKGFSEVQTDVVVNGYCAKCKP